MLNLKLDQLLCQDDVLEFQDSDRQSVLDYLQNTYAVVDTPTRLLNNSNSFLPISSIEISKPDLMTPHREYQILKEKLQLLL